MLTVKLLVGNWNSLISNSSIRYMKQLNEFEKQMLLYRIGNLKNLSNKDFMVSFAGIVNDFDLLQKEDLENLQDHDWCRDNIRHEYTIIKPLSKDVSNALVEEKKDNTGRQRYYDNVFYPDHINLLEIDYPSSFLKQSIQLLLFHY